MSGYDTTTVTRRLRRRATGTVGAVLVLLMTGIAIAVPAQAATSTVPAGTVAAGTTWAQLIRQRLALDADLARLTALLPSLRATADTRDADLGRAQQSRTTAAAALADATTADQDARSRYATARTAAATVKQAYTAALQRRPRNNSQVAKRKRALAAADANVRAWAATVGRTASAVKAAQAGYDTATEALTAATTALQRATTAVSDARKRITALPRSGSVLAAQASAISEQVVVETRADFTVADTTQVYGITVNKIVAYPFQRMIDDAARAGVPLSGGGFRTRQQQIALRTTNGCPDVWTAPASSCRVPTAIPGHSLHELGLAIDLTSGKSIIGSRKSAAFTWLAANAGRYGFVNLPSEPWHWSITGG